MPPRHRPVLRALAAIVLSAAAAMPAAASSDDESDLTPSVDASVFPPPVGSVTRRIRLDTRLVDVVVDVANVSAFAAAWGPRVTSSIHVTVVSADGRPLPEFRATRVKLERVRPPMRVYTSRLTPAATVVFDPFYAGYSAQLAAFAPNALLRATITLVADRQTRTIRVGELRVRPALLVQPTDGGLLTD